MCLFVLRVTRDIKHIFQFLTLTSIVDSCSSYGCPLHVICRKRYRRSQLNKMIFLGRSKNNIAVFIVVIAISQWNLNRGITSYCDIDMVYHVIIMRRIIRAGYRGFCQIDLNGIVIVLIADDSRAVSAKAYKPRCSCVIIAEQAFVIIPNGTLFM